MNTVQLGEKISRHVRGRQVPVADPKGPRGRQVADQKGPRGRQIADQKGSRGRQVADQKGPRGREVADQKGPRGRQVAVHQPYLTSHGGDPDSAADQQVQDWRRVDPQPSLHPARLFLSAKKYRDTIPVKFKPGIGSFHSVKK